MTLTDRRKFLASAAGVAAAGGLAPSFARAQPSPGESTMPFRFCLNTSTIRERRMPLAEIVDLVADAGYDGIEPWIGEIQRHVDDGGSLDDLRKQIADRGLLVESAIGFANWIVDDEAERRAGLEQAKRDMELVRGIGGTRIAAPPAGATNGDKLDLFVAAERYRALLEVGAEIGVTPQLEVWGFSTNLSRLGESVCVCVESGRDDACLLPDVFHIYKGGSDFAGLNMLGPEAIHVFHLNDYPADPPRERANDSDRVYPGDGVAPLTNILGALHENGFRGALSLELFNREYWRQDPAEVAAAGLAKMQQAVARALQA